MVFAMGLANEGDEGSEETKKKLFMRRSLSLRSSRQSSSFAPRAYTRLSLIAPTLVLCSSHTLTLSPFPVMLNGSTVMELK